jgi:hypothetical protein
MAIKAKKSLSGGVDLTHFDTPSLRRGVLLQARVTRPGKPSEIVSRSAREARELGLLICEHGERYNAATERAIAKACDDAGAKFHQFSLMRDEFIRSRYAPGLILDFPSFSFMIDDFKILGRSCLTICFNNSASKIWARLVLSEVVGQKDAKVTWPKARRYFGIGSAICENVIGRIRALYLRDFKSTLEDSKSIRVEFKKLGNLTFLGIDEPLELVESAIGGVRHVPGRRAASETTKLSTKLTSLVNLGATGEEPAPQPRPRIYQRSAGPAAMFVGNVGGTSATIAIASAPRPSPGKAGPAKVDRSKPSSSLAVSKDMAHHIASKF